MTRPANIRPPSSAVTWVLTMTSPPDCGSSVLLNGHPPAVQPSAAVSVGVLGGSDPGDPATPVDQIETCEWLLEAGHKDEIEAALHGTIDVSPDREAFIREHRSRFTSIDPLAFDLVRLIDVVRMGVRAEYLSAKRGWSLIMPAARQLREAYPSWSAMGAGYLAGLHYFQARTGGMRDRFVDWQLTDPGSPCQQIDWAIDPDRLSVR